MRFTINSYIMIWKIVIWYLSTWWKKTEKDYPGESFKGSGSLGRHCQYPATHQRNKTFEQMVRTIKNFPITI